MLADHLRSGGEPARTAMALYGGLILVTAIGFTALYSWVTHDNRLLGTSLSKADLVRVRIRFGLGLAFYGLAFALAFVSPPVALALYAVMALYYAFDQASVGGGDTEQGAAPLLPTDGRSAGTGASGAWG